jgi:methanogenic corrinoid protein MtbC1
MLPPLPPAAPLAIGGTISGDPYMIPATMVEVALREAGWRAESYGTGNPLDTLCAALARVRPALLWLSVSTFASAREFREGYAILHARAVELGIPVALGGRALTEEVRREIQYSAYCDTLAHLVSFSRTLRSGTSAKAETGAAETTDS